MKLTTFFKKDKRRLDILLILLLGCLVFTWFEKDYIFSFGDYRFNFNPTYFNLSKFFYVWDDLTSLGSFNNAQTLPDVFPNQLAIFVLAKLGLPVWFIQRLIFYFIFCTAGIGAYYLGWQLFKKRLAALVCCLFYLFNLSILVVGWTMVGTMMYFYPFAPWLTIFYIKLIKSQDNYWRYILMLSFVFVLSLPAAKVAIYPVLDWFIFVPYLVFYLLTKINHKSLPRLAIKKTLILLVVWLGLNAFWLLPYIFNLGNISYSAFYNPAANNDPVASLRGSTKKAYLFNSIRLLDYNVFQEKFMDVDPFYKYSLTLNNKFFTTLSFLPPIIAFSAFLFARKREHKKIVLFFTILAIIYLYLEKGTNPPLSDILIYLVKNNPVFSALRNPLNKISILLVLSYAVLIAFSTSQIYEWLKSKKGKSIAKIIIAVIICLINVLLVYPFWTRQVFGRAGEIYRSSLVKIPLEYRLAGEKIKLLNPDCQYRILGIPITEYFGMALDWPVGYDSLDPKRYFFCQSSITMDNLTLVEWLNRVLKSDDLPPVLLSKISSWLGIKYFIFHNDIALNYFNVNPSSVRTSLEKLSQNQFPNISKLVDVGKLSIYENQTVDLKPKIYLPDKLITTYEPSQSFSAISAIITELSNLSNYILVDADQWFPPAINDKLNWQTIHLPKDSFLNKDDDLTIWLANDLPQADQLKFEKLNPTKYRVTVEGSPEFFFLNFVEKFDRKWKIYYQPTGFKARLLNWFEPEYLPEINHFTANLHSNGWLIRPSQASQKLELVIEYKSQRLVYFGLVITCLTLLVLSERLWLILRKNSG